VDLGPTTIEYWRRAGLPSGRDPIVFLHPWRGCWLFWRRAIAALPDRDCLAIDLYSVGKGEWREFASPDGLAKATQAVLDSAGIQTCVLVGNSMGGFVAQILAAALGPRVSRLMLIGIGARSKPSTAHEENIRWLRAAPDRELTRERVAQLFSKLPTPDELETYVDALMAADKAFFAAAMSAASQLDLRRRLSDIATPTLIVRGELDPIATSDGVAELLAGIRGSQAVEITGAGHSPQVDSTDEFVRLLRTFVDR
jgi:3-oxoadipate enol-lactonase